MDITVFTVKFQSEGKSKSIVARKENDRRLKNDEENKAQSEKDVDELTDLNIMESIKLISIILRPHNSFLKIFNKCL